MFLFLLVLNFDKNGTETCGINFLGRLEHFSKKWTSLPYLLYICLILQIFKTRNNNKIQGRNKLSGKIFESVLIIFF